MRWALAVFGILLLLAWIGILLSLFEPEKSTDESHALKHKLPRAEPSIWVTGLGEVLFYFVFIPLGIVFIFRPEFVFSALGAFIAFCFLLSWKNKRFHFRFSLQRLFISSLILSTSIGYTLYIWNADFKEIWGR